MAVDPKSALARARACIHIEMDALDATAKALNHEFVEVAQAIEGAINRGRKLIFSGVGKSAHIAQKLVGTFNSTGVSSCFLDATQALHGDLGLCAEEDVAIVLSNSGQSEEIVRLVPVLKRFGVKVIALTSQRESDLAHHADFRLIYHVPREACPLELPRPQAPLPPSRWAMHSLWFSSRAGGLTREDFARFHPAGNLGRLLLLKVKDIMRTGDRLPVDGRSRTLQEAILAMTKAKSGSIALIHGKTGKLSGILTDGDFRRSALSGPDFLKKPVTEFMTRTPKTIGENALAVEALRIFESHKIDDLIVVNPRGQPVGLVDGQDLPKLKIV